MSGTEPSCFVSGRAAKTVTPQVRRRPLRHAVVQVGTRCFRAMRLRTERFRPCGPRSRGSEPVQRRRAASTAAAAAADKRRVLSDQVPGGQTTRGYWRSRWHFLLKLSIHPCKGRILLYLIKWPVSAGLLSVQVSVRLPHHRGPRRAEEVLVPGQQVVG